MSDQHTVYISYRRPVSSFIASALYQHLLAYHFDVFMDTETTDTEEFDAVLLRQINARAHFLIVLTPGDAAEYARPDDWQRRKIEHALHTGRHVVPILVHGFEFADAVAYLTGELMRLWTLESVTAPPEYFGTAMERLRQRLMSSAPVAITPMPHEDAPIVQRKTHRMAQLAIITEKHLIAEGYFQRAFARPDGDHAGKIEDYTEALRILPAYPLAYLYRSNARRILDDLEGAIADATAALELEADNSDYYVSRGIAYYLHGDYEAALGDYTQALELQAHNAAIYLNRGDVWRALNRLHEAWADYQQAVVCSPPDAAAYQAYCRQFSILPARNVPQMLATFAGYHCLALNNLGELARLNGEMQRAIDLFGQAVALAPTDIAAYTNRAETLMQLDGAGQAIADFTRALELDPRNDNLYHQRGFAYQLIGNPMAALADYNRALELNERSMMSYCNRAEIYLAHDKYPAALADWNAAHGLRPGYPLILAGLALTHHGMGSADVAADVWKLLVNADPRFADAEAVGKIFNWQPALIEKTRALLAALD